MAFYSRDGLSCQCNIKNKCDGCNGKYIMPTKGDQIRSMSDEELAAYYFTEFFGKVPYCHENCPEHNDCQMCLLEWLRQECER